MTFQPPEFSPSASAQLSDEEISTHEQHHEAFGFYLHKDFSQVHGKRKGHVSGPIYNCSKGPDVKYQLLTREESEIPYVSLHQHNYGPLYVLPSSKQRETPGTEETPLPLIIGTTNILEIGLKMVGCSTSTEVGLQGFNLESLLKSLFNDLSLPVIGDLRSSSCEVISLGISMTNAEVDEDEDEDDDDDEDEVEDEQGC
ncbi:hypothetical protein CR513_51387, partial [Mucuna pruriens]